MSTLQKCLLTSNFLKIQNINSKPHKRFVSCDLQNPLRVPLFLPNEASHELHSLWLCRTILSPFSYRQYFFPGVLVCTITRQ